MFRGMTLSLSRAGIRSAKHAAASMPLPESRSHVRTPPRDASFPGRGVLAFMPLMVYFYILVLLPLYDIGGGTRIENILFWPTMAGITIAFALYNHTLLDKRFFTSPPIVSFAAYMLLAGASITWAYAPDFAFSRYTVNLLAGIIILLPYALPIDTSRTIQRLHMCAVIAVAINAVYVLTTPSSPIGHSGYFIHKQELGILCGATLILSTHELLYRGWRRWLAVASFGLTIWVIFESQSKGSLAFLLLASFFAVFALLACKVFKTSPAFVVGGVVVGFAVLGRFWSDPFGRIAWYLYGDPTITGRTYIWDFMQYQISHRSWLGWGFHSYWDVPDGPHNQAPGFVKDMISSHSGYLELRVDTGAVGYWIFLVFLYTTLHLIERVRRRDPVRAWVLLALVMYAILLNMLESLWLQMVPIWMLYLIVVGEIVRFSCSENSSMALSAQPAPERRHAGLRHRKSLSK